MGATADNLSKVKYCVTSGEEHSCTPNTLTNVGDSIVSIAEGQQNLHFHICLQGIDKNNNESDIYCSGQFKVVPTP